MSKFGDKLSSIFTVDYDDEYDDYYDDEYEEEVAPKRTTRSTKRERVTEEPAQERTVKREAKPSRTSSRNSKVVPMRGSGMEVCVIKPMNYEETTEIIDTILAGKAVVMNLEGINVDLAQRMIDTVSGACYSIQGNLQKIAGFIYIVTPSSVDISGDFQEILSSAYDFKKGNRY